MPTNDHYQPKTLWAKIGITPGILEIIEDSKLSDFEIEHNIFVEPYREFWKKIFGSIFYILEILAGFVILALVRFEREGHAGHFRTGWQNIFNPKPP